MVCWGRNQMTPAVVIAGRQSPLENPMRNATFALLALWVIALVTTILVVPDRSVLTVLGPVFAVCTIGSITILRKACGRQSGQPRR